MHKEHIKAYTGIRGIAAATLVLSHIHLEDIMPRGSFGSLDPLTIIMNIFSAWNQVDVFFILSGFILGYVYVPDVSNPKINYKDFLVKRIARIVPLHYLTILAIGLMAVVAWHFGIPTDKAYHLNELPSQLLMVHAWPYFLSQPWNGPSWYVSISFFAYLFLVPLLFKFVSKMRKNYLLIALFFLVLAMDWALTMTNTLTDGYGWPAINRVVCQFSIGYFLYSLTTFKNPVSQVASKLVSVWLLLAIVWINSRWPLSMVWQGIHNEFPQVISRMLFIDFRSRRQQKIVS